MKLLKMSVSIFFFTLLPLLFPSSNTTTIIVDGSSECKNPTFHVGDSIIVNQKHQYNIYIFKNRNAFDLCNFAQATLITNPNTASYTWHPSRPGFFYFGFNAGSLMGFQASQRLDIEVTSAVVAATPPFSGEVSPFPFFPCHFKTLQEGSPGPSPSSSVATAPLEPYKSGSVPCTSSNPAVPLPSDEVDSGTLHPLPTSSSLQPQLSIYRYLT